jgi:hypothetical protein
VWLLFRLLKKLKTRPLSTLLKLFLDLVRGPELPFGTLKTLLYARRRNRLGTRGCLARRELPNLDARQPREDSLKEDPHTLFDRAAESVEVFLALATKLGTLIHLLASR